MVLRPNPGPAPASRTPRRNGDDPRAVTVVRWLWRYAPQERGWSMTTTGLITGVYVRPAGTGMVREPERAAAPAARMPRRNGDGPRRRSAWLMAWKYAPGSRGWSVHQVGALSDGCVRPAGAGMGPAHQTAASMPYCTPRRSGDGPQKAGGGSACVSTPRTIGDGPACFTASLVAGPYAPQKRGWSVPFSGHVLTVSARSARAEMVPRQGIQLNCTFGTLRTLGDGPSQS